MARDGRERERSEQLRREAADRLAGLKRTATALEDRLRERTEQVGQVLDRTRSQLRAIDQFVHRHRYVLIGAAAGIGFAIGRRRARRADVGARADQGARYVLVERAEPGGLLRSLAGAAASLAVRQGVAWLGSRMDSPPDAGEPLALPREGRAAPADPRSS